MQGGLKQRANGNGNIQAARDIIVKVFRGRPPRDPERRAHARLFYVLLIACLLATTLPHPLINLAASVGAVILWLTWSMTARRLIRPTLLALTTFSLLSGCAGPMFADLKYPAIVCGDTKPCKLGVAYGVGVLGFGLENIDLETAQKNGGLEKVLASQEVRGYGIISIAQVRVYGE